MTASVRLERLRRFHEAELVEMAREFRDEGDPRLDLLLDDPDAYFAEVACFEADQDLGPDQVPQTYFLLFEAGRLVGGSRVRHRLNEKLHLDGGNIGYEIRPPERGKGHGTAILGLSLLEARKLGLERVLLTAATDNVASRRVIEVHGGVPDGSTISPNTGEEMRRYWIELG
jgi:predicted acetyltransferase